MDPPNPGLYSGTLGAKVPDSGDGTAAKIDLGAVRVFLEFVRAKCPIVMAARLAVTKIDEKIIAHQNR